MKPLPDRRARRRVLVAGAAAVLTAAGLFTAATAGAAADGCKVTYTVGSQWPGGFTANVGITNLGDPVKSWSLAWTFANGQKITQAWNASTTASGDQVTATNASYNGSIATNGTVSFGFNGSWSGSNAVPASFALNGTTCTGSVTSPSPSSPTPSTPTSSEPTPEPSTSTPPSGDAMEAVAAMQPGWNLGNSFDAVGTDETAWGNPKVTAELLDNIKAQGYKSIRIPITWSNHHGSAPDYTIDSAWMARVKEVVGWALDDGFYVMINLHHDSWQWINTMTSDKTTVLNRYNALWTQIAAEFKNHSQKLKFESVNEPQFANASSESQSISLLNELNTSFRSIVRNSGGNNATRLLVIPTLHTSADAARVDPALSWFQSANDPNLIATVHYYGYWPFSVNVAGGTRFDSTAQADLTGAFDRVYNAFITRKIPVIIGEFGLLGFDRHTGTIEQGEKLKFFEFLGDYARQKKITTQLWDNGQHFNRTAFQWKDPELFAQIKSSWTTRSGTASSDQVYVPKSGSITAKTLTLNTNGLNFQGLYKGSTALVSGTDYTVSGTTLTLTASALTTLVGDRAYGVNSDIHARFSAGVPWRISIISSDAPVLSGTTGQTSSFAIPTQFKGDQLATMEAVYSDGGGNAGPHNWTSYKEFDATFAPNYSANTITLKPDFFGEVTDGRKVTLTFHFWSGAKATYYITKSSSGVTGSTS